MKTRTYYIVPLATAESVIFSARNYQFAKKMQEANFPKNIRKLMQYLNDFCVVNVSVN